MVTPDWSRLCGEGLGDCLVVLYIMATGVLMTSKVFKPGSPWSGTWKTNARAQPPGGGLHSIRA